MKIKLLFVLIFQIFLIKIEAQELWGVTPSGGEYGYGLIYKANDIAEDQEVIYNFTDYAGSNTHGDLCYASNGKLYGMTRSGGSSSYGVIFEYDPELNTYKKLYTFTDVNGYEPMGSLIQAPNGKLYGMTENGGIHHHGVIFEFDISTSTYTKKIDFNDTNGSSPKGSLYNMGGSYLYGVTWSGGENGQGVLFRYSYSTDSFTVLHDFESPTGSYPIGAVTSVNGSLYGLTYEGGENWYGVIYQYNLTSGQFSVRHAFDSFAGFPQASLTQYLQTEWLYGTTGIGGNNWGGTLFRFNYVSGAVEFIKHYESGTYPQCTLILSGGKLWGMTYGGGATNDGAIFSYDPQFGHYNTYYNFSYSSGGGYKPRGSLVNVDGKLYGMTTFGGQKNYGVLFKYEYKNQQNEYTNIFDFGTNTGHNPSGALLLSQTGVLYGTTNSGGKYNKGVLYKINPINNYFEVLKDFDGTNTGSYPTGSLFEANNGKLYGFCSQGGSSNFGVIFEYDPNTNSFSKKVDFNGSNGRTPIGSLNVDGNGTLYGVTKYGGANDVGVAFQYDAGNSLLNSYDSFDGSNGSYPTGKVVEWGNYFWGITEYGGQNDYGVLFKIYNNSIVNIENAYEFGTYENGIIPTGSLVVSNNSLIGMTSAGGVNGYGVIFQYNPQDGGSFFKRIDLNYSDGTYPVGNLIVSYNDNQILYGTTASGGNNNLGTLFEFDNFSGSFTKKLDFNESNGAQPNDGLSQLDYSDYSWTGSSDGDWSNPNNWSGGPGRPLGINSVVIQPNKRNYPTLNSDFWVNDLVIKSNASLKGQENLTINGMLTIEREITGYSNGSDGWHFLSSPVSSQAFAGSDFLPSSGNDDVFEWNEVANTWYNYYGGDFSDTQFEVGKGYLVAYNGSETKEFNGDFNITTVTKNLSYTDGFGNGWNLLGNPYPSAIDWELITKSGDVNNSVYIIDAANGTYKSWNGSVGDITDGEIPVNQGFFVKANSAGQSISMETADQVHSTNGFNKAANEWPENSIQIQLMAAGSENATYLQFREDASLEFDGASDAYKLFGFAEIPQLYTQIEETDYSINAINFPQEAISIALGISLKQDADLSLVFNGLSGVNEQMKMELEDKTANKMINLREQSSYEFRGSTSDEAERFVLHFSQVTGVQDAEAQAVEVYAAAGRVYIRQEEGGSYHQMRLYDLSGRLIRAQSISQQGLQSIDLSELKGVYLVQLQGEDGSITEKVTL